MTATEFATPGRSTVDRGRRGRSPLALLRTGVVVAACVPLVAACATGFGAPTRHAVANMQAAEVNVGENLRVNGLIVALPTGDRADKGGVAYIEFTATNMSKQSDELQLVSAQVAASAASSTAPGSSSAAAGFVDVANQQLPVGSAVVPAATAAQPGVARLVVALQPLDVLLRQGDWVRVSLQFAKSGAVDSIPVPVQGSDAVGSSFLPSAPPSLPSSPPASPASSAPESPAASTPASAPPASSPAT